MEEWELNALKSYEQASPGVLESSTFRPSQPAASGRSAPVDTGPRREKINVLVRMRPFTESETAFPLKQVISMIGDKIIVRDLEIFGSQKTLTVNPRETLKTAECLEFYADYMQDDSYLQMQSQICKEESQKRMYDALGAPCIENVLDGYNTTVLTYGQTGSGKTYTMVGDGTPSGQGIIPRLASQLMHQVNQQYSKGARLTVQVSFLEIYQEKIRDLLTADQESKEISTVPSSCQSLSSAENENWESTEDDKGYSCGESSCDNNSYCEKDCAGAPLIALDDDPLLPAMTSEQTEFKPLSNVALKPKIPKRKSTNAISRKHCRSPGKQFIMGNFDSKDSRPKKQVYLKLRKHPAEGPYVEGLSWKEVNTWSAIEALVKQGTANRTTSGTKSNEQSSRSHAIFTIRVIRKSSSHYSEIQSCSISHINLVDLAGSEKIVKNETTVAGQRTCAESRCINQSLSQLNEVILNLSRGKFVSYRNSVLTLLLKESLGGSSRTFMVANISPAEKDLRESINTLRYATKATRIYRSLTMESAPRSSMIKKMREEISSLQGLNALNNSTSQDLKVSSMDVSLQVNASEIENGISLETFAASEELQVLKLDLLSGSSPTYDNFLDCRENVRDNQTKFHHSDANDFSHGLTLKSLEAKHYFQKIDSKEFAVEHTQKSVPRQYPTPYFDFQRNNPERDAHAQTDMHYYGGAKDVENTLSLRGAKSTRFTLEDTLQEYVPVNLYQQGRLRAYEALKLKHRKPLLGCEPLEIGSQIDWKDFGGTDVHQQVNLKDYGAIDIGLQTALLDFGALIQNQRNWYDSGAKDAYQQVTLRDCGALDFGLQTTLQDCGALEITTQTDWPSFGVHHFGNQVSGIDRGAKDVGHGTCWRYKGAVDSGHQISMRNFGTVDFGLQTTLKDCGAADIGLQTTLQDCEALESVSLRAVGLTVGWPNVTSAERGYQIGIKNFGSCDFGHQTTFKDIGTLDSGQQTDLKYFGALEVGTQIDWQILGTTHFGQQVALNDLPDRESMYQNEIDTRHQINTGTLSKIDFGHQATLRDCMVVDLGLQGTLQDSKLTDIESLLAWQSFEDVFLRHTVSLKNLRIKYAGYVISGRNLGIANSGSFGLEQKATWKDCGTPDNEQQTTFKDLEALQISRQIDWQSFGAVGSRHPSILVNLNTVDMASSRDIGSADGEHQMSNRNFGTYNPFYQINVRDSDTLESGLQTTFQDCGIFEVGMQVDWRNLGGVKSGHQVTKQNIGARDCQQNSSWKGLGSGDIIHQIYAGSQIGSYVGHWVNLRDFLGVELGLQSILRNCGVVKVESQLDFHGIGAVHFGNQVVPLDVMRKDAGQHIGWRNRDKQVHVRIINSAVDFALSSALMDCEAVESGLQTTLKCFKALEVGSHTQQDGLKDFMTKDMGNNVSFRETRSTHIEQNMNIRNRGILHSVHHPRLQDHMAVDLDMQANLPVCAATESEGQIAWKRFGQVDSREEVTLEVFTERDQIPLKVGRQTNVKLKTSWQLVPSCKSLEDGQRQVTEQPPFGNHSSSSKSELAAALPWSLDTDNQGDGTELRDLLVGNHTTLYSWRDFKTSNCGNQKRDVFDETTISKRRVDGKVWNSSTGPGAVSTGNEVCLQCCGKVDVQQLKTAENRGGIELGCQRVSIDSGLMGVGLKTFLRNKAELGTTWRDSITWQKESLDDLGTLNDWREIFPSRENNFNLGIDCLQHSSYCSPWIDRSTHKTSGPILFAREITFQLCFLWSLLELRCRILSCQGKNISGKIGRFKRACLKHSVQPENARDTTWCSVRRLSPQTKRPILSTEKETGIEQNQCIHEGVIRILCSMWILSKIFISTKLTENFTPNRQYTTQYEQRPNTENARQLSLGRSSDLQLVSLFPDETNDPGLVTVSPTSTQHCSVVESFTVKTTLPFLMQTDGGCSIAEITLDGCLKSGLVRCAYFKLRCGRHHEKKVHVFKGGVNHLGSDENDHLFVDGFCRNHSEFIYMPPHHCWDNRGYVVVRLVALGATASLNGVPLLHHVELTSGDVLELRDANPLIQPCQLYYFNALDYL